MHHILAPVANPDLSLPEVAVRVERRKLAKRRWRGTADDGAGFGFELAAALKNGAVVHQTPSVRYVIRQEPENVLEISLEISPSAAAGIGWAVGNLHLELSADATRMLTPDEPASRQLLERIQVPFRPIIAIFRAGRFARGAVAPAATAPAAPVHELGSSHKH